MADPYAHLLVRKQFDWWEDVENDIPLTTTLVNTPTVLIKTTKRDEYAHLLMREQFDWCEDVENDIVMKDKSIAMATGVPIVGTENIAASSTDYATAIEPDGGYPQLPINHHRLENTKDNVASTCSASVRKNDEYPQFPVDRNRSNCANDDISVDITSTGPTTGPNVAMSTPNFLLIGTQTRVKATSLRTSTTSLSTMNFPMQTTALSQPLNWTIPVLTSHTPRPNFVDTIPERFSFVEDAEDDVAMDVEDLELGNERHTRTHGPVTAVEQHDSYAALTHPETFDLVDDAENDIAMKTGDPVIDIGLQGQLNEYEYRAIVGSHDENIHHWNWFGCPVYTRSTTPPPVSLAFIQAEPKAPKGNDELRVNSILNRAIRYIDPVIIVLDRENEGILQTHGTAMVEGCHDNTYTHYSLYGNWMTDDFSMRRMIIPDAGTPGNGLFGIGPLISRHHWMWRRGELVAASQGPVRLPRKLTWKATPSKLNIQSMLATDYNPSQSNHLRILETASKFTQKTWLAAKRISRMSISLPAGIMGTMIKKAWCRPKTDSYSTSSSRLSIMGGLAKKTWATITCILQKYFGFSLGNVKAGIKKAVFIPHRLVPDVLLWLLSF